MKSLTKIIIATIFFLATTLVQAVEPIGFERWTPTNDSKVEFNKQCSEVQKEYNAPSGTKDDRSSSQIPHAGSYTIEGNHDRAYRVMDIEVKYNSHNGYNDLDIVAVKNYGPFARDSWVLCGLTTDEVQQWADNRNFALLDVEPYERKNGELRWAIILQKDPFKLTTLFFPSLSIDNINETFGSDPDDSDWRVLDIDYVGISGGIIKYSVVVIQNFGDNHILWNLEEGWSHHNLVAGAYQLVDRERIPHVSFSNAWLSAMLSVAVDNDYWTLEHLDQDKVKDNHGIIGVTVDLEAFEVDMHAGITFYEYYTVNADQY